MTLSDSPKSMYLCMFVGSDSDYIFVVISKGLFTADIYKISTIFNSSEQYSDTLHL